jgi:hypothetical protein
LILCFISNLNLHETRDLSSTDWALIGLHANYLGALDA